MKTITICASSSFYEKAVKVQEQLERLGFKVLLPDLANQMKEDSDFDVSHYKTWAGDANDYHKKTVLIHGHFKKIEDSDAILVLNYEKHGVENYIGGNVLMEMGLALYLKEPILVLNEVPEVSYLEEIMALQPILLHGNIDKFPEELEKALAKS